MGRGDRKTKRGKIFVGSYGKLRPKPKTVKTAKSEKTAKKKDKK